MSGEIQISKDMTLPPGVARLVAGRVVPAVSWGAVEEFLKGSEVRGSRLDETGLENSCQYQIARKLQ